MLKANQFNLTLAGESFALVGQQNNAPRCVRCRMATFLIHGLCEPCINEHAQELIEAEARQGAFFTDL